VYTIHPGPMRLEFHFTFPTCKDRLLDLSYGTKCQLVVMRLKIRLLVGHLLSPSRNLSQLVFVAAASDVQNEPLAPNFSGILGLALPLNSVIASSIPPVTGNDPDGAAWASNLFSITPVNQAPSAHFLSLTLSRPGSDQIPSLLGIGRHPSSVVPDPSQVRYSPLVGDQRGVLFWKVTVRAITVYVDGDPRVVPMGRSVSGGVFPTATLDSGAPLILTTSTIANAIYGAIGINPASDGLCACFSSLSFVRFLTGFSSLCSM